MGKEYERWSKKIHDEDSFSVQNQNASFPVVANIFLLLLTNNVFYLFAIQSFIQILLRFVA
jgi:hypothetical protein